jgi:flavin reductase (DIM6/NTAB) family NADH-FMN oxidoreductase RutF
MDTMLFKEAMTRVAGPVAVVTAAESGVPHGTTVSALASLSLSPPLITVALDNASVLLGVVQRIGIFGINLLAADQCETATRFAGSREDRFTGIAWEFVNDLPRLSGISAWLQCRVAGVSPGGDHTLLLGEVEGCATTERESLVYSRRTFGIHVCLPVLAGPTR